MCRYCRSLLCEFTPEQVEYIQSQLRSEDPPNFSGKSYAAIDFSHMGLQNALFNDALLTRANFKNSNLRGASFKNANVREAIFTRAFLYGVDFTDAKLPPAPMLLQAQWDNVSPELVMDLMRYDASNHPHPEAFDRWVEENTCPMHCTQFTRAANFMEDSRLWKKAKERPLQSALQLVLRLFDENKIHYGWSNLYDI